MPQTANQPAYLFRSAQMAILMAIGAVLWMTPLASRASSSPETPEDKFDTGAMIMHHISDAHQIHIIGQVYIPLPVILFHDGHLDIFSSSRFWDGFDEHGELKFRPFTASSGVTYENHHEQIVVSEAGHSLPSDTVLHAHTSPDSLASAGIVPAAADSLSGEADPDAAHDSEHHASHDAHSAPMDFSITKTVFGMLLVVVLMIVIFRSVAKAYEKRRGQAPKGLQNLLEPFILFVRNEVAIPSIGAKKADRYVPFLLTVFFFIWMCNLLGLIPFVGGFNVTGTLSVTLVLALIVFLITTFSANSYYWGHILWPPGVPLPIKFILVPIEILGIFMKPAVLMIRLTANITAGHIIILAFVGLVLLFGQSSAVAGYSVGVGAVLFMVFMFFIELLVAFLQAYVFTLLTAIYFGDATHEHHHDNHESH